MDVSLTLVSFGIELSMKRRRPMGSLTIGILDYDSRHEAGQKDAGRVAECQPDVGMRGICCKPDSDGLTSW